MVVALLLRAMPEPSTLKEEECAKDSAGSCSKPWCKTRKVPHHNTMIDVQDALGPDPHQREHHRCKALRPLIRRGAPRPRPSLSELEPMWTPMPLSRLDTTIGMKSSLGSTTGDEAGGTTPSTIATHRLSLWVPSSSVR